MNTTRDPGARLAAWLDEGPTDLPDATRRAIVTALPLTNQARRGLLAPRRLFTMPIFPRVAAVMAVVVLLIAGGVYLAGSRSAMPSPLPTTQPTATAAAPTATSASTPLPTYDTSSWVPFVSARYGFTVSLPGPWVEFPSDRGWDVGMAKQPGTSGADRFEPPSQSLVVAGWRVDLAPGESADTWLAEYIAIGVPSCAAKPSTPIRIDGLPGQRVDCTELSQAIVSKGDHVYLFAIWSPSQQELFRAILATVRLPA